MTAVRSLVAFLRCFRRAFDLWNRLGFPAKLAWKRAAEWQ